MKREELEKKIRGLEGLVEAQRNTIQELAEKTKNIGAERNTIFEIIEPECSTQFRLKATEKDLRIITNFIDTFNRNTEEVQVIIYKEVTKDE